MVQDTFSRTRTVTTSGVSSVEINSPRDATTSSCKDTRLVAQKDFDLSHSLELSLGCALSTRALLASVQANPIWAQNITEVIIRDKIYNGPNNNKSVFPACIMSSLECIHLFGAIGATCRNLQSLRVALDTVRGPLPNCPPLALPVAALTAFFEQAPTRFMSLKISAIIFAFCREDFDKLEQVIRQNAPTSWKDVRLDFCEPARGTPSLDPLLEALAAAPQLEQVSLSGTSITHTGLCTGPSLVKFVSSNTNNNNNKSSSCTSLHIWGGKRHVQKEDICALLQSLETNTTLKELTIHAKGVCPIVGRAIARCLSVNKTLERLILNVQDNSGNNPSTSSSSCRSGKPTNKSKSSSDYVTTTTLLAKALQHYNRTIRLLSLDYSPEGHGDFILGDSHDYDFYEYDIIDNAHRFAMWKNRQAVSRVFTEMLHCNSVLEVLWMNVDDAGGEDQAEDDMEDDGEARDNGSLTLVTPEMDMLLRLNRYGIRQNLLEKEDTATSDDWMDALASQNYDLNALYYLVSRNPSLCKSSLAVPKRCAEEDSEPTGRAAKRIKRTTVCH